MADIFLSYVREDLPLAEPLVKALTLANLSVFQDVLSIKPGQKWQEEIKVALRQARAVIFFASKASIASPSVNQELGFAMNAGLPIISILVDVQAAELPSMVQPYQALSLHAKGAMEVAKSVSSVIQGLKQTQNNNGILALVAIGLVIWLLASSEG